MALNRRLTKGGYGHSATLHKTRRLKVLSCFELFLKDFAVAKRHYSAHCATIFSLIKNARVFFDTVDALIS